MDEPPRYPGHLGVATSFACAAVNTPSMRRALPEETPTSNTMCLQYGPQIAKCVKAVRERLDMQRVLLAVYGHKPMTDGLTLAIDMFNVTMLYDNKTTNTMLDGFFPLIAKEAQRHGFAVYANYDYDYLFTQPSEFLAVLHFVYNHSDFHNVETK